MVTDASSALQTISDTSPVRALQSVQSAAPTCHRGAAVLVFWGQEPGGGAGLYWYWQRRGHLTLQLPCTARTLTDSHHQENCTLGLRQPLHEQATLKLQIANNKGEAGVHLLNSGSFHSSGTLFVCCCVLCMCDSAASCWSWQMAPAPPPPPTDHCTALAPATNHLLLWLWFLHFQTFEKKLCLLPRSNLVSPSSGI